MCFLTLIYICMVPVAASLNLNHPHYFKPHLHYDITMKFQAEIKNENDLHCFYFAFHL